MKSRLTTALSICALLIVAASVTAAEYETVRDRSAKAIMPASSLRGASYRVNDVVPTDGYTDRWSVNSDFGAFDVSGDAALRKLLIEIPAIVELQKTSKTKEFAKGVGGAAKAPLSFVKSLVTHPVDTVTGVPKGAYDLVENAAVSVSTTANPAEDSKLEQVLKMSSYKRDIAARLNVDPYSSNKVLQKNLNSIAWAATIGDWAFSAAMLPAGAAGSVVSNVRLANSVKNVIAQETPQRLRIINDEKMTAMGIAEELRKRFLDQPHFTPRHATIIVANLEQLRDVPGRDGFLTVALNAEDEAQANFYTAMAQMLRGYHETVAPLSGLTSLNRIVVGQAKTGQAFLPLPVDQLLWLERVERVSTQLKAYSGPGFNGKFDLWMTGVASPLARQELAARGFTVTEAVHTKVEVLD
jgi:hypothetical protein